MRKHYSSGIALGTEALGSGGRGEEAAAELEMGIEDDDLDTSRGCPDPSFEVIVPPISAEVTVPPISITLLSRTRLFEVPGFGTNTLLDLARGCLAVLSPLVLSPFEVANFN
jgi:hypothetical protein